MFKLHCPVIFGGLIIGSLFTFTSPILATETTSPSSCSAKTLSSAWRILDPNCDIGKALWGKEPINASQSQYWVQCNYSKAMPDKAFREKIAKLFINNLFLYNDQGHYRCLIGPIDNYPAAQQITQILSANEIKNSFIRQTTDTVELEAIHTASTHAASATHEVSENLSRHRPAQDTTSKERIATDRVILDSAIYAFTFNNLEYYQPLTIDSTQDMPPSFIKENGELWSKVNIQAATNWCTRYQLRLPSYDELKQLQTYGQRFLLRNHWPISNNYWSSTISSYSGEIQTLNLRSGRADDYRPLAQLYTTCVKEAS